MSLCFLVILKTVPICSVHLWWFPRHLCVHSGNWAVGTYSDLTLSKLLSVSIEHPLRRACKAMTKGSWWVKTHPFFLSVTVVPVHQCRYPQTGLCTFPPSSPLLVLPWVVSQINYIFSNSSLGFGRAWSG